MALETGRSHGGIAPGGLSPTTGCGCYPIASPSLGATNVAAGWGGRRLLLGAGLSVHGSEVWGSSGAAVSPRLWGLIQMPPKEPGALNTWGLWWVHALGVGGGLGWGRRPLLGVPPP